MSLTSRLLGVRAAGATVQTRPPQAATQPVGYSAPSSPMTPRWNAQSAVTQGYYGYLYAYRCARTIATTIAGLPFRAGLNPNSPGSYNLRAPLAAMLGPAPGGPAPNISPRQLWTWSLIGYLITGRFAWETVTPAGSQAPAALWPLVAANLKPIPTDGGAAFFSGYEYQANARIRPLTPAQVFYCWRASQDDWREPESVLQAAALPLSLGVALDRYMASFMRNNMTGAKMVVTPGFDDPTMRRAFQDQFLSEMTGVDNAGNTAFAEWEDDTGTGKIPSIQVVDLGTRPVDAQVTDLQKWVRDTVCDAFGVPISIVGQASERTYANADQEHRNYWTGTILPFIEEILDHVNIGLAPRVGDEVGWFDLSSVEALKPASRFQQADPVSLVTAQIVQASEIREDLGLDPQMPAAGETDPPEPLPAIDDTPGLSAGGTGTGSRAAGHGPDRVYHWKHGWIPLDHVAVQDLKGKTQVRVVNDPAGIAKVRAQFNGNNDPDEYARRALEDPSLFGSDKTDVLVHYSSTGQPTGALSLVHHDEEEGAPPYSLISYAGARGKGAGTALTRAAEAHAYKHGRSLYAEPTSASAPFWRKMGFVEDPDEIGAYFHGKSHDQLAREHVPGVSPGGTGSRDVETEMDDTCSVHGERAGTCTGPGPCVTTPFGAGKNWVTKVGGLPDYVRAVAHAFQRKGMTESESIERALGVIQNWASGQGNVTAATRARAAAAWAEWQAKKAAAHASRDGLTTESSSASALLPKVTAAHLPTPSEARGICGRCGQPVAAKIHRIRRRPRKGERSGSLPDALALIGSRHAGSGHAHVPSGHHSYQRKMTGRQVVAHAEALEPSVADTMRTLFAAQRKATLSRLAGNRGRQAMRDAQPDPADERAPVMDAGQLYDVTHWQTRIAEALSSLYAAIAGFASDRMQRFGGDTTAARNAVTTALHARGQALARTVSTTTLEKIQAALSEGVINGASMAELTSAVNAVFDDAETNRAALIARTETLGALSSAADAHAEALGPDVVAGKEWISAHDARVRPMHREADGQVRAMGVPFLVGGFPMQHPGDPAAPPEEVCNCRCVTGYLTPAEYATHLPATTPQAA